MGKMYGVGKKAKYRAKKWRAGLQRMNISMDHLALCTPGLTGFSVESWRLKPAHILLETVVSAAAVIRKGRRRGGGTFKLCTGTSFTAPRRR